MRWRSRASTASCADSWISSDIGLSFTDGFWARFGPKSVPKPSVDGAKPSLDLDRLDVGAGAVPRHGAEHFPLAPKRIKLPVVNDTKDPAHSERLPVRTRAGFGEFVRGSRIRAGVTQGQLAQAVGKSRRWLQDVERGKVNPSLAASIDLAAALGYEIVAERATQSPVLDQVFGDLP